MAHVAMLEGGTKRPFMNMEGIMSGHRDFSAKTILLVGFNRHKFD